MLVSSGDDENSLGQSPTSLQKLHARRVSAKTILVIA